MAAGSIIEFSYAGKVRICTIVIDGDSYIKAENHSCDNQAPSRPFSNYNKASMSNVKDISILFVSPRD